MRNNCPNRRAFAGGHLHAAETIVTTVKAWENQLQKVASVKATIGSHENYNPGSLQLWNIAKQIEFGLANGLHIREVVLHPEVDACRVCYISDIHLRPGRARLLSDQVLQTCRMLTPDRILLGGDLLDRPSELDSLFLLCKALSKLAPTYAVAGNHDVAIGIEKVQACIEEAGCSWIHASESVWQHQGRKFSVVGPEYEGFLSADVKILCGHNPRIWKMARKRDFDLVLAGHLHGCQFVAFQFRNRLYPGAWFYPYCYLEQDERGRKLVVSRGVADLVPIRFNCPREILLCRV